MQDLGNLKITIEKATERKMTPFIAWKLASKMKLEDMFPKDISCLSTSQTSN